MQKKNRIFMRVVAMLLCIVLITSCLVATIFARYVARDKASVDGVKLKKWGITIETGSHAKKTYTDANGNTVVATKTSIGSANAIAPGMRGSLAWFHVFGSPEVEYKINFDGRISIGNGYSDAVVNSNEEPLAYFPIVLYLVAYDVTYDGNNEMILTRTTSMNASGKVMDFAQSHLRKEGTVRNTLASTETSDLKNVLCWQSVSFIQDTFNGDRSDYDYMSLDKCFDQFNLSGSIDRVYALEWCWPYNHEDSYPRSNEPNFKQGRYVYPEYDTQLGEKMRDNAKNGAFDITLDMSVTVEQSMEPLTDEKGVNRVYFGEYPQSIVENATLEAELDKLAEGLTWSEKYETSMGSEHYIFVDVEYGGEKYRGLKYYEDAYDLSLYAWFKYEPISWIVLEEKDGKAFLVSEFMLDKRKYQEAAYNNTSGTSNIGLITAPGFPQGTYANNWEYSSVRKWLNTTFYETAFNNSQSRLLLETEVDNSASTTQFPDGNQYASDTITKDKIFLLSYQELVVQHSEQLKKVMLKGNVQTDYSRDTYYGNTSSYSFTRSPNPRSGNGKSVTMVGYYGTANNPNDWYGLSYNIDIGDARGVRPAMWVEL